MTVKPCCSVLREILFLGKCLINDEPHWIGRCIFTLFLRFFGSVVLKEFAVSALRVTHSQKRAGKKIKQAIRAY